MPTTLIVVISWVSFWLEVDSIPGRITLGVTTLLTISTESRDQQANLAPVSYVKALDVWMGACTMFVFAAVLEFTIVNCLARRKSSLIAEPHAKIKSFIIDIVSSPLISTHPSSG
ncbi:hypothetical protein LAZ67_2000137 [Cordylochernes scorpioides]|uniref:Neurotransmitter-gated ion-channel transmembrane domain-containing protein n=1 Tax=Cordylochernes scorpioides TaxID=51811 RepID=A0ABY6K142_9ARAC|nr:hypothetical protein LAZ67_2000137 [Cordylochernes scorpioides]